MATSDDLVRRWREAKLGERRGDRVAVWVECEGDPRAEVLGAIDTWRETVRVSGPPEAFGLPSGGATGGEVVVTDVDRETGTVTIADAPPRRSRKRGGKS